MLENILPEAGFNFDSNKQAQNDNSRQVARSKVSTGFADLIKTAGATRTTSVTDPTAVNVFDTRYHDIGFEKVASLRSTNPTEAGIAQYLKEYMYNELSFFPDKVGISVDLYVTDEVPAGANTQSELAVVNATGNVNITYGGAVIQLPFMVNDRDILPFDAIQMGNERGVYTRENMRNILLNLKNTMDNKQQNSSPYGSSSLSPYLGIANNLSKSPLTDVGFMGEMLNIQRTLGSRGNGMSNLGVYAAAIDDMLEKTASIHEVKFNEADQKALEAKYMDAAEKLAATEGEVDELIKTAADLVDDAEFADIRVLKNGTGFIVVEKQENEITTTPAFVYDCVVNAAGPTSKRIVVTGDGRYKLLNPGEKFGFKVNADTPIINTPKYNIESLNPGENVVLRVNGMHSVPMIVTNVISGSPKGLHVTRFVYCLDLDGNECVVIPLSNVSDNAIEFVHKDKILKEVSRVEPATKLTYYNMYLKANVPVVCISDAASFLKLAVGNINQVNSKLEVPFLSEGVIKLAGYSIGDINITRIPGHTFTLTVTWNDPKFGRKKSTTLDNITESKLIGALNTIGYDRLKVATIVANLKSKDVEMPLPQKTTPWLLKPELTASAAASKSMKDMKSSLFNVDNVKRLAGNIGSGLLSGLDLDFSALKSFASESAGLSVMFEKLAGEYSNHTLLEIAGLMTIKNRVDELIKSAAYGAEYAGTECLAGLKDLEPCLTKVAGSLIELKVSQAVNHREIVSPVVIASTLKHLDGLYKYTKSFN